MVMEQMPDKQEYYTVSQAALELKVSEGTIRLRSSLLDPPPLRVGRQGTRLLTKSQVEEIRHMKERR